MLFSSLIFLLFFLPAFFIMYFVFKTRYQRNIILLIFSLIFYAWGEPLYILLMLFSIGMNYFFGLFIEDKHSKNNNKSAKTLLIINVALNLLLIGIFKYTDFVITTINSISGSEIPLTNIPLPIGISFYTFQIMSYVIDVYRKEIPAQKNVLFLGAYLCGFPQLIAGPIVRYQTVMEELENRTENMHDFAEGLRRFSAGLAKKILIANNMAAVCDGVLNSPNPETHGALGMWMAVIAYTLQIYYDFSGYSDMAIGMGRMMGFHYLENFNYPYIAQSVTDFWRRWHMSLSTFFKDYVYIPLGGNRVSKPRWIFNTMVVWMLTGLWHGADYTFILWGLYFGILLIVEKTFLQKSLLKIPVLRNVYAIIAFIFGWIIFRAASISEMAMMISTMFGKNGTGDLAQIAAAGIIRPIYIVSAVFGLICVMPISRKIKALLQANKGTEVVIDISSICALVVCIVILMVGAYNPFIYFRF